ncbi:NAD(P)-dependent oxidoreductase [Rhodococcus sp. NPDC079359]|uniref:NAD(P)-dependent oxidoreductase n=1 Tax=Rhodococcus sp. NPDC079359 TaxID=3154961 RepID=UPI00344B240E
MRITFIAPGNIGRGIALRLLAARHDVIVWARHRERVQVLIDGGASWAATPGQAAVSADLVLSCLRTPAAVREIFLDGDVLACARAGQVFVEHGTFSPELAMELDSAARDVGAAFVDCPVSGGPSSAHAGTLTLMIGGDADTVDALRPVFAAYSERAVRVGPVGSGQKLKLINQVLVAVNSAAAAEAAAAVVRAGLDSAASVEALAGGWAQSAMMQRNMPRAFASDYADAGAPVTAMAGVLVEVDAFLRRIAAPSPVFDAARSMFDHAARDGGTPDIAAIARPLMP